VGDRLSEAKAMVSLIEPGGADQNDVARLFGYSVRTVRRYQRRFEEGGLAACGQPEGYALVAGLELMGSTLFLRRRSARSH
jgi:transposase